MKKTLYVFAFLAVIIIVGGLMIDKSAALDLVASVRGASGGYTKTIKMSASALKAKKLSFIVSKIKCGGKDCYATWAPCEGDDKIPLTGDYGRIVSLMRAKKYSEAATLFNQRQDIQPFMGGRLIENQLTKFFGVCSAAHTFYTFVPHKNGIIALTYLGNGGDSYRFSYLTMVGNEFRNYEQEIPGFFDGVRFLTRKTDEPFELGDEVGVELAKKNNALRDERIQSYGRSIKTGKFTNRKVQEQFNKFTALFN